MDRVSRRTLLSRRLCGMVLVAIGFIVGALWITSRFADIGGYLAYTSLGSPAPRRVDQSASRRELTLQSVDGRLSVTLESVHTSVGGLMGYEPVVRQGWSTHSWAIRYVPNAYSTRQREWRSWRYWYLAGFGFRSTSTPLSTIGFDLPHWFILLLCGTAGIRLILSDNRRRARARESACAACGYPSVGLAHATCPECGRELNCPARSSAPDDRSASSPAA